MDVINSITYGSIEGFTSISSTLAFSTRRFAPRSISPLPISESSCGDETLEHTGVLAEAWLGVGAADEGVEGVVDVEAVGYVFEGEGLGGLGGGDGGGRTGTGGGGVAQEEHL